MRIRHLAAAFATAATLAGTVIGVPAPQAATGATAHAGSAFRPASGPKPALRVPQLRHRGRWLVDSHGRVVFLHGVNAVYKHRPYVTPPTARGFTASDANFLAAHGINAVRLGVLFAGVMPRPGVIDRHYLRRIGRIVKLLTARKVWVLLDFHQDAFNEKFHGEGFPDWAVHDDGLPFVDLGSFFLNDQTPAVQRAYDHLWHDDAQLWRYYAQAWTAVARKWRHQPYLMGYDLFNEPNAGSQMATCANPAGCPLFDARLESFYDHVRRAIRRVDRHNLVWYEPQFLFNAISRSNFTHVPDREVALSWHDYACTPAFVSGGVIPGDPDCKVNEPRVMDNAETQMRAMGAGGVMSEFGAGDDLTDLTRLTTYADQHLTGWMYWAYKNWNDPTGSATEGMFGNDARLASVKRAKLRVLVHPYPQAVAGIPTAMSWNADRRVLTVRYRARPRTGLTDVFVPRLTYHGRYAVRVAGGRVSSRHGQHVFVAARRGARKVAITVRPRQRRTAQ